MSLGLYGLFLLGRWILVIASPDPAAGGPVLAAVLLVMTGLGMALCVGAHLWPSRVAVQRLAPVLAAVLSGTAGVLLINGLLTDRPNLDGLRSAQGKSADALETLWVAPAASLAFMVTGAALYLARTPLVANAQRLTTGAVILVTVLGFLGLAGGLLELEHLYRLARHVRMPTDTAIGLCGVAAGLWFLRDQLFHKEDPRHPHKLAHRIVYRAAGALSLAAVGAGLAGFAAMHHTFKATVAESTAQAARTQALALANTLRNSLWFPRTVATRPTVIQTVAALDKDAEDASARQFMPLLAASFLTAGIDGVRFTDSQARLIGVAGAFPAQDAAAINTFRDEGQEVELRWNGGYVLHTRTPVHDGLRVVGHVHTQRRLVLFDELVGTLRSHSETSDALICSQRGEAAFCAPTRFYPTPFEIPMFTARGEPTLPINRALLGESGVTFTTDLRQVPVVAGYTPIGKYGLGLVVKVDVATLYGPLKTDLNYAVLAVALLVALGTWALKTRVQPLLRAVVDEQLRTQAILATSGDAFIALGVDGRVTDWNAQAQRVFGWSAEEAVGRTLGELVVPPEAQAAHARGFADFVHSGAGPMINQRVETNAVDRHGNLIPVEMSITSLATQAGFVANGFVRDIRERRLAQRKLADSERRLADVLSNIPAMVGHFDREQRCQFASDFALRAHGRHRGEEVGLPMSEALGAQSYALHRPHLAAVLDGRRVRFEGTVDATGKQLHFQAHMVPERSDSGEVVGFYLMSFDVTALKQAQLEQERGERRLRAIADNLPVMITYIDREERLRFLNRTFELWTGIPLERALNQPLREVIGDVLYNQRAQALRRGLSGERVEFEVESQALGVRRILQTVYIPDLASIGDVLGVYTLTTDVTALRQSERRMAELAMRDKLTGLANRRLFDDHLPAAIEEAVQTRTALGLLLLDVDHFKTINDTRGHPMGDFVLAEFAKRLCECVRTTDLVARVAGDEFAVVLGGLGLAEEAVAVARKIVEGVRVPLLRNGEALLVTTSIGIAYLHAGQDVAPGELLTCADDALYEAKRNGRNGYVLKSLPTAHMSGEPRTHGSPRGLR